MQQLTYPEVIVCQSSDCSKIILDFGTMPNFLPRYCNITVTLSNSSGVQFTTDLAQGLSSDLLKVISIGGSIDITQHDNTTVGTTTSFLTELASGDYLLIKDGAIHQWICNQVYSITNDTELECRNQWYDTITSTSNWKYNRYYEIPASSTVDGIFSNGSYTLDIVFDSGVEYTNSQTIYLTCSDYCCVYNKLADLANICDDCIDGDTAKQIIEALFMWGLLQSYMYGATCGNFADADAIQARLDKYCNSTPCKNC